MGFLGLLDVAGIQRYLMRSSELADIAEASDRIEEMGRENGLFGDLAKKAGAKVLVAAGGNAALMADSPEAIQEAMRRISHCLLEQGNGLQIVVTAPCQYKEGTLAATYKSALKELELRKLTQPRSLEFSFAGLRFPVPYAKGDNKPDCHPVDTSSTLWKQWRSKRPDSGLIEPTQFKNMICESEEASDLMAVVSMDGIGMGQRMHKWLKDCADEKDDAKFKREYQAWSQYIKERWSTAWMKTLDKIEEAFAPTEHRGAWTLRHPVLSEGADHPKNRAISLYENMYKDTFFPCRHIYQGGDDLTFVCDARLAMSLTAFLACELENPLESPQDAPDKYKDVPEAFKKLTVSIGVVFVDSHFPFSRAIRLAEETRQRAKKRASDLKVDLAPSVIDWWVNRQGALVRPQPSFEGASYKPYKLHGLSGGTDILSWEQLETMLLGRGHPKKPDSVHGMWTTFLSSRGKMKDVLAAAESGAQSGGVRRLLRLRPLEHAMGKDGKSLPFVELLNVGINPETGFAGDFTPLLDAGELYDIHFPFRSWDEEG